MNCLIKYESGLYEVIDISEDKAKHLNTTNKCYSHGKEWFTIIQIGIDLPSKNKLPIAKAELSIDDMLDELELSTRCYQNLRRAGITHLSQITNITIDTWRSRFGDFLSVKDMQDIGEIMKEKGLKWIQ